jgi:8-oxo-dGTP diphosphatase
LLRAVGELDVWKHCPRCCAAVEKSENRVECGNCGFRTYATSKPTASALCVDDRGRVLLARRAAEPFEGKWDLPGGFLEEREHPLDGLKRELREETGVDVEPGDFLGIWMDTYGADEAAPATLNMYWTAKTNGEPKASDDVAEFSWFGVDELPDRDEFAFANTYEVLSAWRGGSKTRNARG